MRNSLRIAVVQPICVALNVTANARVHAKAVHAARTRVVAFPELSLTGYELDADTVSTSDTALTPIIEACADCGAIALVGAPTLGDQGRAHISVLRVDQQGVTIVYRKMNLGDAESLRFSAGEEPTVLEVDCWRLGLGICKDTGVADHVQAMAALEIDAYLAGVAHLPEELPEQEARAVSIARRCNAYVAFASFAGPTGGEYERTAGCSAIWSPAGDVLARAGAETGGLVRAIIV